MKTINILKTLAVVGLTLILSTSVLAQEKPAKEKDKECCTTTAKHECTDECKTEGCASVKTKEAKDCSDKHVCTEECKTAGCDAVKAKGAKANSMSHVCNSECKTAGCDAVKAKEAKAMIHKCGDDCKEGCKV